MRNLFTVILILVLKAAFSQSPHYYEVIHNLSNWDSTSNGLKTKNISLTGKSPQNAIVDLKSKYQNFLDQELKNSIDSLKQQYKSEGIFDTLKVIKTVEQSYILDSTIIVCYKHTLNYEYTDIINLMLIDSNDIPHLLSFSNKLGINFKIKSLDTSKGNLILYGKLQGNPEFNCGGIVKINFIGNKRIWDYSYCESNN